VDASLSESEVMETSEAKSLATVAPAAGPEKVRIWWSLLLSLVSDDSIDELDSIPVSSCIVSENSLDPKVWSWVKRERTAEKLLACEGNLEQQNQAQGSRTLVKSEC
jgi:hypothetical protein